MRPNISSGTPKKPLWQALLFQQVVPTLNFNYKIRNKNTFRAPVKLQLGGGIPPQGSVLLLEAYYPPDSRRKSTGYSLRSSKKVMLEVPIQAARYPQHLVVEHSVLRPQSSGTTYLVKHPALTLCQILNAMWKHIFLNKLLICSRVFVSFILLFIIYYHFISFLKLSTCL